MKCFSNLSEIIETNHSTKRCAFFHSLSQFHINCAFHFISSVCKIIVHISTWIWDQTSELSLKSWQFWGDIGNLNFIRALNGLIRTSTHSLYIEQVIIYPLYFWYISLFEICSNTLLMSYYKKLVIHQGHYLVLDNNRVVNHNIILYCNLSVSQMPILL